MPLPEDNGQPASRPSILGLIGSAAEQAADRTVECLETKARKTADELKEQVNNYFQKLLEKKSVADQDIQRLHGLIEEYSARKSRLSQWAEWHGSLAWYEEAGYILAFVGIGALVGFAFNLAALFTLISIAVVSVARSLFMEHYDISLTQNDALIAGVSAMIDDLILSISQLTTLTQDVNAIQVELDEKCTQMDIEIGVFRADAVEMNGQMDGLKNQTLALEQAKAELIQENERISLVRDKANLAIEAAGATIAGKSSQLTDVQNNLDEAHQKISGRSEELTQVQAKMGTSLIALSEVKQSYARELTFFTSKRAEMSRKGGGSKTSNEKPVTNEDIEQQILKCNDLILQTLTLHGVNRPSV